MSGFVALAWVGAALVVVMAAGWWWQQRHRNAGIVDVLWTAGLGLAGGVLAVTGPGAPLPRAVMALLIGLWSLRLAAHLWRRVRSEPEDGRYRHLRRHWQDSGWKFFAFFQAQVVAVVLFALPLVAVAANPVAGFTIWTALGIATWGVALGGEAIADHQLARFRADPRHRGRTCDTGLWRYSRHPNYFFEWLHWFAYVFLAQGSPLQALAWSGPVVMYVFLRYLSGIPFTEAQALRTRGEDYRDYQRRTPAFFPAWPRASRRGDVDVAGNS